MMKLRVVFLLILTLFVFACGSSSGGGDGGSKSGNLASEYPTQSGTTAIEWENTDSFVGKYVFDSYGEYYAVGYSFNANNAEYFLGTLSIDTVANTATFDIYIEDEDYNESGIYSTRYVLEMQENGTTGRLEIDKESFPGFIKPEQVTIDILDNTRIRIYVLQMHSISGYLNVDITARKVSNNPAYPID